MYTTKSRYEKDNQRIEKEKGGRNLAVTFLMYYIQGIRNPSDTLTHQQVDIMQKRPCGGVFGARQSDTNAERIGGMLFPSDGIDVRSVYAIVV